MKNIVVLMIYLFVNKFTIAQDISECNKIVLQTYEAINQKNADQVIKYLSDDFSIAGQQGEAARLVLLQFFDQLNVKITNIKKNSETKTDVLTLVYEAEFGDKGIKKSTFVFNTKNQLKSLELIPMQEMTKGAAEVDKTEQAYFTVPFKRIGNLISVQVKLNGVLRTFLVDNGSPILVLNSTHIEKDTTKKKLTLDVDANGAGGSISNIDTDSIQSMEFGYIKMKGQKVITMDLSHLEEVTKTTFYGLVGYEIYKDYDLLFDYKKNTITFIKPESTLEFLKNNFKTNKQVEVPLVMGGHLAVVDGYINGKKYSFGIDCGAESGLFDIKLKEELIANLSKLKTNQMAGADKNIVEVLTAKLNSLIIGGVEFKKTETQFSDISHLNDGYGLQLDGLIGFDILSKYPTLISYKDKKIIFLKN